jgi:hypothetical protein
MRHNHLEHRFVQYIPERLDSGVLYISMEYATAAHRCCCGLSGRQSELEGLLNSRHGLQALTIKPPLIRIESQ